MSSSVIALGTFGRLAPKGTADGEIVAPAPRVALGNMVVALPRHIGAGFAAGVTNLYAGHRAAALMAAAILASPAPCWSFASTQAGRGYAAFRGNTGGFNDDQAGTPRAKLA